MSGSRSELQTTRHALPQLPQFVLHILSNFENSSLVSASVAVIRGREDRDHILVVAPVIALTVTPRGKSNVHDELVRPGDQTQIVLFVELATDIASERVASTTRRNAPTRTLVWVGPQQIAHASFVRVKNNTLQHSSRYSIDFHYTVQFADLVESRNGRR